MRNEIIIKRIKYTALTIMLIVGTLIVNKAFSSPGVTFGLYG